MSGDTFFEFDYGEVHRHFGIDEFLLGFEAARHHGDALIDDELDAGDTEHLRRCALKELLSSGDYFDPHLVRSFFGSSATLFFSLYNSIWPKLSLPAGDAFDELLGLRRASYVDIDHAWQFVDQDDWTHIDAGADVR